MVENIVFDLLVLIITLKQFLTIDSLLTIEEM